MQAISSYRGKRDPPTNTTRTLQTDRTDVVRSVINHSVLLSCAPVSAITSHLIAVGNDM